MATEVWKKRLDDWTRLATSARAFVLALVALIAAIAALVTGVGYLNRVLREIATTREQAKAGVTILATDVEKVQKAAQQNHEDIVNLNAYLLSLHEAQIDAAISGNPPPVPPPLAPKPPSTARVTTPAPTGSAALPPAPTASASPEPPKTKKAPPSPPTPGPKPETVDPMKATDVFKP